jgi:hypothetical protein
MNKTGNKGLRTRLLQSIQFKYLFIFMLLLLFLLNVSFYIYIDEQNSMGCLTAVFIFSLHIFIIIYIIKIVMFKYVLID